MPNRIFFSAVNISFYLALFQNKEFWNMPNSTKKMLYKIYSQKNTNIKKNSFLLFLLNSSLVKIDNKTLFFLKGPILKVKPQFNGFFFN